MYYCIVYSAIQPLKAASVLNKISSVQFSLYTDKQVSLKHASRPVCLANASAYQPLVARMPLISPPVLHEAQARLPYVLLETLSWQPILWAKSTSFLHLVVRMTFARAARSRERCAIDVSTGLLVRLLHAVRRRQTNHLIRWTQANRLTDQLTINYCKKLNSLKHLVRTTVAKSHD